MAQGECGQAIEVKTRVVLYCALVKKHDGMCKPARSMAMLYGQEVLERYYPALTPEPEPDRSGRGD